MKNVKTFILGLLCVLGLVGCSRKSASIGIIGGADGPTAIFVTSNLNWMTVLGMIALAVVIILVLRIIHRNKKNK